MYLNAIQISINATYNVQFLVLQDIGTKSNTSIFITFIIMQLAVEQKLTIPNPFIHRSISSYSETHFYSVTDRKKEKAKRYDRHAFYMVSAFK